MSKAKSKPYKYGDPAPNDWQQASEALKGLSSKPKSGSKLMDRLDSIEAKLKERK